MARITKSAPVNKSTSKQKVAEESNRATNGNDSLIGTLGNDQINGLGGNDNLYGNHGNDTIYGGAGADKIWGGHGNDYLVGGSSDKPNDKAADVFYFERSDGQQRDTIAGFEKGIDKININLDPNDSYSISLEDDKSIIVYHLTVPGPGVTDGTNAQIDVLGVRLDLSDISSNVKGSVREASVSGVASSGRDSIVGFDSAPDRIDGLAGNDSLYGASGDDTLIGGTGRDKIWGGRGNDYMIGGSSNKPNDREADVFYFAKSDGQQSDIIVGFDKGIDKIEISLDKNDICTILNVNNNTFISYNHFDASKISGLNISSIHSSDNSLSSSILLKDANIGKADIVTNARVVTINDDANSIVGTLANDTINGFGGNDSIYGNHGNDAIYGGYGSDEIWGGYGSDHLYGGHFDEGLHDGAKDTFCFMKSDGNFSDAIIGFEVGVDKIRFVQMSKGSDFVSITNTGRPPVDLFPDWTPTAIITYKAANGVAEIYVQGVAAEQINIARDFIFDLV